MACRPPSGDPRSEPARSSTSVADAPSPPTTIGAQLEWATRVFESVGAPEPAKEAGALLASIVGLPISQLRANAAASLSASHVDRFLAAIVLRMRDERRGS
jgi:PrmC N-terminal domain